MKTPSTDTSYSSADLKRDSELIGDTYDGDVSDLPRSPQVEEIFADQDADISPAKETGDILSGHMAQTPRTPSSDPKEHIKAAIDGLKYQRSEIDRQIATLETALASLYGTPNVSNYTASTLPRPMLPGASQTPTVSGDLTPTGSIKPRKKPEWHPDARQAARDRMKAYWEQRHLQEAAERAQAETQAAQAQADQAQASHIAKKPHTKLRKKKK